MAIRAGEDWGAPVSSSSPDAVVGITDREIAEWLAGGRTVIVRGGTLHSSLGAPEGHEVSRALSIDLLEIRSVVSGERLGVAVSSVLIRRRGRFGLLWGRVVLASNCGEFDGVSACPRAHPNDGRIDFIEVERTMSLRQRRQAWRKAASGSHLPHPALKVWSGEVAEYMVQPDERVFVDGNALSVVGAISIRVLPDAGTIFI